jgi:hypothetical protein
MILAIDPGPVQSAWVIWGDGKAQGAEIIPNAELLAGLRDGGFCDTTCVAVEMIACYGMPVGAETFETCKVIGRIEECCHRRNLPIRFVYRRDVKMHLCGNNRAKDGNIRQALIDKLGPVGTKKKPGPCYGIASHLWAALAVAITAQETQP